MPFASSKRVGQFEVFDVVLGEGGFGKVFRAKDTSADPPVLIAAKKMKTKDSAEMDVIKEEVAIMEEMGDHPNFVRFHHFFEEGTTAWIFMELASGGELFDRLIDSGSLSEKSARSFLKGISNGLSHMHHKGIAHRDLKLENVMLVHDDPCACKIIDLGLAARFPVKEDGSYESKMFTDPVGSRSYRAPEILSKTGYEAAPVDLWALGIVAFSLVSGFFPLDEARSSDWRYARLSQDQAKGIGACDAIYSQYKRKCPFTPALKELCDSLLTIDTRKRSTISTVVKHSWFETVENTRGSGDSEEEPLYRSISDLHDADAAGDVDWAAEEELFCPPENAMKITRQLAGRLVD